MDIEREVRKIETTVHVAIFSLIGLAIVLGAIVVIAVAWLP